MRGRSKNLGRLAVAKGSIYVSRVWRLLKIVAIGEGERDRT